MIVDLRFALVLLLTAFACRLSVAGEPAKPNILLIVADDLGWADVGYHGAKIRTPNIDNLAISGVELDRHYVQPVCTPTRTALMTGRYPSRFGRHPVAPSNLRAFPLGTVTIASALKSVGYKTYIAGKWHLGSRPEWGPNHYGFDESYGSLAGAADPWTHKYRKGPYESTWHRNELFLDEEGNVTELIGTQAVKWIRERKSPWFIYVPFQAVHIPVDSPDEYKRIYANEKFFDDPVKDESKKRLAAFVSQMDAKVGQLIDALDETGQRSNTLVVFHSDNGGLLGGTNPYVGTVPDSPVLSSNIPLRGAKDQLYEGGVRVVAWANWPGRLEQRKVTATMHAVDWMPTLTRLVGYRPKEDLKWDGQDVWPLLTGAVKSLPDRRLYIPHSTGGIVRDGDWKLIVLTKGDRELYDVTNDPHERNDLAREQPERVERMLKLLEEYRQGDSDKVPEDLKGVPG